MVDAGHHRLNRISVPTMIVASKWIVSQSQNTKIIAMVGRRRRGGGAAVNERNGGAPCCHTESGIGDDD